MCRASLRLRSPERIGNNGEILTPLDEKAVQEIIRQLRERKIEAVGVCLLWSIVNPVHEERVGKLLAAGLPGIPYTLSHAINASLREYRRASSTCIDASLRPLISDYLGGLADRLRDRGFAGRLLVVTSQGGVMDAAEVARTPIHCIKSGPAMAPVAGHYYAHSEARMDSAIVTGAGGTTYDVSLVRGGRIPWTRETWIGKPSLGHMTGFPSVDVRSIGAGDGSIAWVDEGGLLHVGPDSTGSLPGPACYARGGGGGGPTLTDAALALGYIDPNYFLDGRIKLDMDAAKAALERDVASPLGLDPHRAAAAVLRITTENMVAAIEEISINQGVDPRQATLVGGGGAAGLNAIVIARRLGCPMVIIPDVGAALSAAGALISKLSRDFTALFATRCNRFDHKGVNHVLADLKGRCQEFIKGPGTQSLQQHIEFAVEARYAHQIWEIEVPLCTHQFTSEREAEHLKEDFHAKHREIFAIEDRESEVKLITWRARVSCVLRKGDLGSLVAGSGSRTRTRRRSVFFEDGGALEARIYHVEDMKTDRAVPGPAIIESPFTTVVIDPGAAARRRPSGLLLIDPNR